MTGSARPSGINTTPTTKNNGPWSMHYFFRRPRPILDVPVKKAIATTCLLLLTACQAAGRQGDAAAVQETIKARYRRFLTGTDETFTGSLGIEAAGIFLRRIRKPIARAMALDCSIDRDKAFRTFPGAPDHGREASVYSPILQQYLLSLAYGYCVNAPGSTFYRNPDVLRCALRLMDYLHARGIRSGMTFHNNPHRMNMPGAPKPAPGAANLARMELRMGAFCQAVLLLEPYFKGSEVFKNARALVRHLEMLGRTSGHVRYYEPYRNPEPFRYRVQSDAIQNFSDTTLVSALLETNPERRAGLLLEAKRVFTDSLKVIPGWADTIKPDFTGFHHRGIYGNAYTGGFIPQAAFGVHLLEGTHYEVDRSSVENLKNLMLTYRLYCQKYAMPFGIRGRMPLSTSHIKTGVFTGILIYASKLGLDDAAMKPVFARLWDREHVGLDFLFSGGRGKVMRGLYPLDMLKQLNVEAPQAEPDPAGFWFKPYGGLAIHRRDDWMAAIKGHSKYVWDYENGTPDENVYGQYLSHGVLTIFSRGRPVSDIDSGYRLDSGWDWYRMPGATAVHFPMRPQKPLAHRRFSPETFMGGVSCDGENGLWAMVLNQPAFADGTRINLKARKSAFFVDDLIILLGTGISGGDGIHPVETTIFQSSVDPAIPYQVTPAETFSDPAGNGYYIPDAGRLKVFNGRQKSYRANGRAPSSGHYAVAWLDHGLNPAGDSYQAAILVRGADRIAQLAGSPTQHYKVMSQTNLLHHVDFPAKRTSGFVFFEAGPGNHDVIHQVGGPCLLMCRRLSNHRIRLGVTQPDLGFLPPDAPAPDFRFIARNENQYLPSRPRPVDVVLKGRWRIHGMKKGLEIISTDRGQTTIRFHCIHGMAVQAHLERDA